MTNKNNKCDITQNKRYRRESAEQVDGGWEMVNSEITYQYLLHALSSDYQSFRLGQLVFNKVTTSMSHLYGIDNQPLAFRLATIKDKLFIKLLKTKLWSETHELNLEYYRSNPSKALLLNLYKKCMQVFQHHTCLGILIEACSFGDSFPIPSGLVYHPSALYHLEDKDLIKGFERLLRAYNIAKLSQLSDDN